MDPRVLEQALKARDPRFDGRFFIGVRTTGIYCRPVCAVKSPKLVNVRYFPTAAAAAEAGFRPCLRCRPESSPGTPAWAGTSATVQRGLRLIGEGALDDGSVEALADRLGVTSRHLSRLFLQHLGASPLAVAQTRRLHFAKKLLNETDLPMTEVALSAGYGSVRRFNDHVRTVYGRPPSELRRRSTTRVPNAAGAPFTLRLPYRPPFDFDGVLEFLSARATPGVESVGSGAYRRTIVADGDAGTITVAKIPGENQLQCDIDLPGSRSLFRVVDRLRRLFDLEADPLEIGRCLRRDRDLAPLVKRAPGRRVPGAWNPFEIAVRAIVGQQVSVKAATGVMGIIAREFGTISDGRLCFPAPESLAGVDPGALPMPRARASAISALACAVAEGDLALDSPDPADLAGRLTALPGIGPWTAQYVAMRAAGDPDAFPAGDLVLQRVAEDRLGIRGGKALLERAERWRPWRAYAAMHLWALTARPIKGTKRCDTVT